MADDPTIADIIGAPNKEQVLAELLVEINRPEVPITDWHPGAVLRTAIKVDAEALQDLVGKAIPAQIENGFIDADPADTTSIGILSHGLYAVDRDPGSFPIQTVTLTCAAGHGPYPAGVVSSLVLLATDGRRYTPITTGALATSGTVTIDVKAESPGAARALVSALEAPLGGVTVTAQAIKISGGVPQFGSDPEPAATLAGRCESRFADPLTVETTERLERWVKAPTADLDAGDPDQVTRVKLDPDDDNPGGIVVTVAGAAGAVGSTTVDDAQAYVDARLAVTDYVTVQDATNVQITAAGVVTVPAALAGRIKAAANRAWVLYLLGVQIGARVFLAELTQAVMNAGAIDITGHTLNGTTDVALGASQVPTPHDDLADDLTWVEV